MLQLEEGIQVVYIWNKTKQKSRTWEIDNDAAAAAEDDDEGERNKSRCSWKSIGATHRPSKLYGCITRFQLYQRISIQHAGAKYASASASSYKIYCVAAVIRCTQNSVLRAQLVVSSHCELILWCLKRSHNSLTAYSSLWSDAELSTLIFEMCTIPVCSFLFDSKIYIYLIFFLHACVFVRFGGKWMRSQRFAAV